MVFKRTRTIASTAARALLLSLAVPTAALSQTVPRFVQLDVPRLASPSRPLLSSTSREVRSPTLEREHLRAQRIINRVCSGC
ncbi:hypothetical protein OICFNHDK_3270 [Methylobacterium bullatum]|uniref:Secreted protein n=1 Tax=Methylobacterium bullatum TaxID=570505 RepID=A0AAV4ZB95_9HYPH|nr:hypothetical protein [Methylobacterium bullatum]GJD40795.1 hypothetical protein OICFNHDK_3270 [Methylobacterium bullatum]